MGYLFYLSVLLCGYSYFLYPLFLKLVPSRQSKAVAVAGNGRIPQLSLIITAYNEEERIREKLENTLKIDYPPECLEIIVASDFSTDATDEIVGSYVDRGVRLVRADQRKGKEYAQWCAIREASGEVLVFSDVATQIPEQALRLLAEAFADKQVGAVSSEDRFLSEDGGLVGEGAYVRYEMWLRGLESERRGLVGLSGSFFAARREVCQQWDIYSPSDFNTALNCAAMGYFAVTCPQVLGYYRDVKDPKKEYQRKVRTVMRGINSIVRHPDVLNPFKMGLFAFQVWSHKIMRWAVPWFLLVFAGASIALLGEGSIYIAAFAAQVVFYGLAFLGWVVPRLRSSVLVRIIYFFVQTNLAIAEATILYLAGRRMTVWTPTRR